MTKKIKETHIHRLYSNYAGAHGKLLRLSPGIKSMVPVKL
uniref:Uncharacterized protein n=1 Tax=Rhizophora mucronata TaxID=61149 RepID=A0A2P2PLW5_RHIMU